MPYPVLYDVTYSYTAFQLGQGNNDFPGTQLDADLQGLQASIDNVETFTQSVMRSDGALNNGIVTYDSLSPGLQTAGLAPAVPWVTGFGYSVNVNVSQNGSLYRCLIAHTSGVFATDLAAGDWLLVATLGAQIPTDTVYGNFSGATAYPSAQATTGSGAVVRSNAPAITNLAVGTQAPTDNSTLAASTAFVKVAAVPPGEFRVETYGAVGDAVGPVTGSITSGQFTFTKAAGSWVNAAAPTGDVGKLIVIQSAGVGGLALCAVINSVAGPIATLSVAASQTALGTSCWYGTDNAAAIEAAWAAAKVAGGTVSAGSGTFAFGHSLNFTNTIGVTLQGRGLQSGAGPTDFGTFFWPLCDLSSTTGNAFDPSGSTHINFKDFQLGRGDLPNRISTGILVAAHSGAESICWSFENVLVMGTYLLSGIYQYGVPNCRYTDVQTYNYMIGLGTSYGAHFTCNNDGGAASAYGTLNSGAVDTSNVYALNCQFAELANTAGLSTSGGALRLNGVDSFTFESGFLGSTHRCIHIGDTTANFGSRNVRISQTSLQGYVGGAGPTYCCEITSTQTIMGLAFVNCRVTDASLVHTSFTTGPTTAFLQSANPPALIVGLRIEGPLLLNVALLNGGGAGAALALSNAYLECNGAAIVEPGSVDNSNLYINPGVIIPQAGARSDAEQFPRKVKATESYSFNMDSHLWGAGAAAVPTSWTLTGAAATIAKNTTAAQLKAAAAGVALTRVGNDCRVGQTISNISGWKDLTTWQGKTLTFGRWAYATVAGRARISIFDGTTRTYSAYHSGGGTPEFLTVTAQLGAAATEVTVDCFVDTGNATAVFSAGAMIAGSGLAPVVASPNEWRGAVHNLLLSTGVATIPTNSTHAFWLALDAAQVPFAAAGVLSTMYTSAGSAAGAGQSFTYTLRKNTANTSITTSISGASATTANDLTDQVQISAGDTFDILTVVSATGAVCGHSASLRFEERPL